MRMSTIRNTETLYNMRYLIILQHFIGIKRSYLLENSRQKLLCNLIFVIFLSLIIGTIAYDGIFTNILVHPNYYSLTFQLLLCTEAAYLLCTALFQRKTFEAIRMLDEKCVSLEEYSSRIETKSFSIIIFTLLTLIFDLILMWKMRLTLSNIVLLTVAYAVHDTEMGFYSILISGLNLKLSSIVGLNVGCGLKVYRHVLLIASHIKKEFNFSILLTLGITFVSSVVYCVIAFLIDSPMRANVTIFLVWRELKSLFALYLLCSAASDTKSACEKLIHYLSNRLVFNFEPHDKSFVRDTTHRLYLCVKSERPRYVNGSIFTIDLGVPLRILDISVNYLLIILQIYKAYVTDL